MNTYKHTKILTIDDVYKVDQKARDLACNIVNKKVYA